MAKILSHVWSSISGSVGGITYFNGPHHAILARARVAPVQPGSTNQALMRSAWAGAAGVWENMPLGYQQDWDLYAQSCTFQGKQGNYQVTGRSIFMAGWSLQSYMLLRFLLMPTQITDPPVQAGFLLPSNISLGPPVAAGTGFSLNISADPFDDTTVFVQISGFKEKERNFWKGPWDNRVDEAFIVAAGVSTFHDFLGKAEGKKYFIRVKCVADDAPSRVSEEFFLSTVAETTVIAGAASAKAPAPRPKAKTKKKSAP